MNAGRRLVNKPVKKFNVKRGQIYRANLSPTKGFEQKGINRPVLILQNDFGNNFLPTTIVAVLSDETNENLRPNAVNIYIDKKYGLSLNSIVKLHQVRVLDVNERLIKYETTLPDDLMAKIDEAIMTVFGLYGKCSCGRDIINRSLLECSLCKSPVRWKCSNCANINELYWKYCPICGKEA